MVVDSTLGQRIKELRERKGLSQQAFAELIGVKTYQRVYQYESGRRFPNRKLLARIAEVLEVEVVDVLLGDDGAMAYREAIASPDSPESRELGITLERMIKQMEALQESMNSQEPEIDAATWQSLRDAIIEQKDEFVGQITILNAKLEKRDADHANLLKSVEGVFERLTTELRELNQAQARLLESQAGPTHGEPAKRHKKPMPPAGLARGRKTASEAGRKRGAAQKAEEESRRSRSSTREKKARRAGGR